MTEIHGDIKDDARSALTFKHFQAQNRLRCEQDFGHGLESPEGWIIEQWTNALAGEVGELCNMIKKKFSRRDMKLCVDISVNELGAELADIISYVDLIASKLGLCTETILKTKFNIVSDRVGSNVKI